MSSKELLEKQFFGFSSLTIGSVWVQDAPPTNKQNNNKENILAKTYFANFL